MKLSHWEHESFLSNKDLVVVGSGIVGLSAAIEAKRLNPQWDILILERGILPSGASTKNAGFACFGSPSELIDDLKIMTEDEVFSLVEKRWKGLLNLRELLGEEKIGLKQLGGCECFTSSDSELYNECKDKLEMLNNRLMPILGQEAYTSADHKIDAFGFSGIDHLIYNKFEGQIDTGKMAVELIRKAVSMGIIILYGFPVDGIAESTNGPVIHSNNEAINADRVIVATNGFAQQLLPELDVQPARAQVLITQPIDGLRFEGTFHYDRGYYYFRNVGNRILFGGGRNLDPAKETTTKMDVSPLIQNELDRLLKEVIIPGVPYTVDRRWSGIMGVGDKKTVIVKEVSDRVVCAVRMGGMGVAIGSLIGKEAAELIADC